MTGTRRRAHEKEELDRDKQRLMQPLNEATLLKARENAWLRENADAIKAHNERIARSGTLLEPIWLVG